MFVCVVDWGGGVGCGWGLDARALVIVLPLLSHLRNRWNERLPRAYLQQLNQQKNVKLLIKPDQSELKKCNEILELEFKFFTCGYVANEVNMVYPELPPCKTVCATTVKAYFLKVIVAKALDGQRYPLPLSECMRV